MDSEPEKREQPACRMTHVGGRHDNEEIGERARLFILPRRDDDEQQRVERQSGDVEGRVSDDEKELEERRHERDQCDKCERERERERERIILLI